MKCPFRKHETIVRDKKGNIIEVVKNFTECYKDGCPYFEKEKCLAVKTELKKYGK